MSLLWKKKIKQRVLLLALCLSPAEPPLYFLTPSNATVKIGSRLELRCHSDSRHNPSFLWLFNGTRLPTSDSSRLVVSMTASDSVLTLPFISEDLLGVYTCEVTDDIHLPRFASSHVSETGQLYTVAWATGTVHLPLGSTQMLECPARSGAPPYDVSWFRDKNGDLERLEDGVGHVGVADDGVLTVSAVVAVEELEEVEGEYVCVVEDRRGARAEASFTVAVTSECRQSCYSYLAWGIPQQSLSLAGLSLSRPAVAGQWCDCSVCACRCF